MSRVSQVRRLCRHLLYVTQSLSGKIKGLISGGPAEHMSIRLTRSTAFWRVASHNNSSNCIHSIQQHRERDDFTDLSLIPHLHL